ncbi:MAG: TatD family hydrolase [Burkholderiales bacterium]|nr:TatD family hydrolase [Burkholderiales bacterium]MDE1927075.1 TatD family hydrolase [Burkholderiales bacterium]MDE2160137.1 TatD family hydrolase [Burkholderiales bacterium]MDE2504671.1 TatD family hydrolase [Burkholderiales bacterium]
MYVDSHCHLSDPGLLARLPQIRRSMAQARVERALVICTTLEEFPTVHALATGDDGIWCTVGVHPDQEGVTEPTLDDLRQRAALPRVVGIGETGLDYYRLGGRSVADMAWQRERFRVHIRAARATGLPLIVHTRSASADTLAVLADEGQGAVRGVFHCFTETMEVAEAALALGFHISFSGILTFRNAAELREVARRVPLERCLIETDSPYLAPLPHRGKTNEPAYVVHVAAQLAALKGVPVDAIARATTANFERLFALPGALPASPAGSERD